MDSKTNDRRRGALIGLAVGDALGAAVEFSPPGTFKEVTDFRAGGPHGLKPGEWTDDTSMALALADSIGQVGWNLNDQATKYLSWQRYGIYSVNGTLFDIGGTTAAAVARFSKSKDARTSGDDSPRAAGNGSIMRLAPVPIALFDLFPSRIDELATKLIESSLPTHASPQCLSACAYLGIVLAGLMHGLDRAEVLDPQWSVLETLRGMHAFHEEVWEIALGSFRHKNPPEILGSGYVIRSLEAALWAFYGAQDFRDAVLRAVNLGNDADSTGAVCGQLAGAFWGEAGIPQAWRDGLARKDIIEPILQRLLQCNAEGHCHADFRTL